MIVDSRDVNRHFVWRAASAPLTGDGQEKGKKKASDGRHDVKNPDVFNGPPDKRTKLNPRMDLAFGGT